MKHIFKSIAMALLLSASCVHAQQIPFQLKISDVFKDEYKRSSIVLVEDDSKGGVVIVRSYQGGIFSSGIGYYIEHYDSNMKLIKEYEYEMKYSDVEKQSSVLGVIMDGEKVNLVEFLYNRDAKSYICSSINANINDFKFTKKELFRLKSEEIKQFSLFSGSGFDNDWGASMIINEDRNAFAITVDIKDKDAETHKLYLYDNKLNQKFEHTFKRDIQDKKYRFENIDVSKDGNT